MTTYQYNIINAGSRALMSPPLKRRYYGLDRRGPRQKAAAVGNLDQEEHPRGVTTIGAK